MKVNERGSNLKWLPLFTVIWFYLTFIPQYSFAYFWGGKRDYTYAYTLSSTALKEVPGTVSTFGAYMMVCNVLFATNKLIWLGAMQSLLGEKLKTRYVVLFEILCALSFLFMWLFSAFFYEGYMDLHNNSATLFFVFELLCFGCVTVYEHKFLRVPRICTVYRVGLLLIIVAMGTYMLFVIVGSSSLFATELLKRENVKSRYINYYYDTSFACCEIVLILAGLSYFLTLIPTLRRTSIKLTIYSRHAPQPVPQYVA